MSVTAILCQCYYCILGVDNLFPHFTGPQIERDFVPGCIILLPNLDNFNDDWFGDFMLIRFRIWTLS